ncbi:hypothetical protein MANES_10G083250v8 [Manihot esculenta]|uniref:Uncharacterized protein n=1 Tax=Manihot esculenta TaxID=3983 RepID=A0ACB7H0X7_MANES|nr:hypothetical protein MANES_10G083250v8 [Manihot esculenta]
MSLMGELTFFLGLQIKQVAEGIFINQSKYIKNMPKKFKMNELKGIETPINSNIKLNRDEKGKEVDEKLYRGMIGSLLYLFASRPDIYFSACLCIRFQSNPKESHLVAIKRTFRYLISILYVGLWYPNDSDFAGSRMDIKRTSGTCQFLDHALVFWFSKKQTSVTLSTTKVEYIVAGSCVAQILWMKQQLNDYDIKVYHVPIKCDNTSAINLTKNLVQHSRTRHIEIRYHFIRDHVQNYDIDLEFVLTEKQLTDIFTKPLSEEVFCRIRRKLEMIDLK